MVVNALCPTTESKVIGRYFLAETLLDDAGIEPEETLFIDDSEINCKAAQNLGISTYTAEAGEDWSHLFNSK